MDFFKRWLSLKISALLLMMSIIYGISATVGIYAQQSESSTEELNHQHEEITEVSESKQDDQNETIKTLQVISGTFSDYIPYVQFNNYQYSNFIPGENARYTILEYQPDNQGIYQVVMFNGSDTVAYVYQKRSDGLYELAYFENYYEVEDKRHYQEVYDGRESLILSSNLSLGYQFKSGYDGELTRVIEAILPHYQGNDGTIYEEVIVLKETGFSDGSTCYYYLAPYYGIICIEKMDVNQQLVSESHLLAVYNSSNY